VVWIAPEPASRDVPVMAPSELMVALPLFTLTLFALTLVTFAAGADSVPPEIVPVL
jgi:hypothetical protein